MATESTDGLQPRAWLTGAVAGLFGAIVTGAVIQLAFDSTIISSGIPAVVGTSGLAVGWVILLVIGAVVGLAYAAVATVDTLGRWAGMPNSGAALGLGFGLVLWVLALVLVPLLVGGSVGSYALSLRGVLAYALLGIVIGLGYGMAPDTGR